MLEQVLKTVLFFCFRRQREHYNYVSLDLSLKQLAVTLKQVPKTVLFFVSLDKENRGNRFDGKRVLDARKAQEGPREPRSRDDRNNRRNRPEDDASAPSSAAPAAGFGQVLKS